MSAFIWGRSLTDVSSAFPSASSVELPTDSQPVASSCGYAHNLVLTEDGSLWSQGSKQQIGRRGNASVFGRVAGLGDEPIVAVAAGALHSCAVSLTGELWEFGLLFERFDVGAPGGAGSGGGGHELAGLSTRLNRNEYLRRIVMRSEAAYLANRNIAEVSAEAVASGRPGGTAGAGAGSAPAKAEDDVNAADILRIKVRRVLLDKPRLAAGLAGVKIRAVACGYAHTLALDSDGQMWASGYNDKGSLGTGDRLASAQFKRVALPPGTAITKIACGQQHNLAAAVDGRCFAWGSGVLGQLGTGGSGDRLAPKLIAALAEGGHHIVDVACGSNHSVVLDAEGAVLAFGHSEYGQMGADGGAVGDLRYAARHYYVPRSVEGLLRHRATAIAAGGQFSLALLWDGSVVSWGWNSYHCLGRGDGERYLQHYGRVAGLAGNRVRQISCGYHHAACTTAPSGSAFAAGWLGVLRAVPENRDVPVYTRKRALAVPAGTANGPKGLTPEEAFELGAGRELGGSDDDALGVSAASSDMYGMFSAAGAGARSRGRGRGAGAGGGGGAAAAAARFRVKGGNPPAGAGAAGAGGAGAGGGASGGAAAADPSPEAEGYVSWATAGDGPSDGAGGCMPGEPGSDEGAGEEWCMPADVLLIPVDETPAPSLAGDATPAASPALTPAAVPTPSGAEPEVAATRSLAYSTDMEAKRAALQQALLKVLGRGSAGADGGVDGAGGDGAAAVLARGALPSGGPIGVHAVMLAHRLPVLSAALHASRTKSATVTLTAGRGCPLITVAYNATEGRWEVQFTGVRRVVLAALAAFLYADVLVPVPAHRLQKLKQLAEGLRLTRLSALCDQQAHAYDLAADFHGEVESARARPHARHRTGSAASGDVEASVAAVDELAEGDAAAGVPLDSTFILDMRVACGLTRKGVELVSGSGAGAAPLAVSGAPAHTDLLVHVHGSDFAGADACGLADGASTGGSTAAALVFPVHRLILCRSEYFRKLIQGDFAEARLGSAAAATAPSGSSAPFSAAEGGNVGALSSAGALSAGTGASLPTLRLEDVEPRAFASLLDYLYTGDLQPCMEDPERCMATLELAARFCMSDLATRLQDILAERVEAADAPLLLEFADTHSLPRLAKIAHAMAVMAGTAGADAPATASASAAGGADGRDMRPLPGGLLRMAA